MSNVFLADVRSLANKIDDLDVVFRLKCVDLALITETWLSNSIPDTVIEIPGYSLLRKDRVERRGGGVGIYIKHTLSFKVLDDLSCPDIESVWVYLRPPKLPRGFSCLVVAVIYHPPGQSQASNSVLTDYIISSVDKIRRTYPDAGLIIGGDFNRLNVAPICSNCALKQVITLPTRGNAILDLLFTNLKNYYESPIILPPIGIADHNSIFVKPVANLMNPKPLKVKSRSVNPYAKLAFGGWLNGINWSFIYNLNSCDEKTNSFLDLLKYAIDCFFPVRMAKLHATDKPWVTPDFKDLVQKRQKAFLSKSCNYPELRNRVNKMANRLKANFFDSKVRGCDDPKKWWSLVKKLSGQPKKSSIISSTIINDKAVHSLELANAINQSFLKVAREMDPLPEVHHIPTSIDRDLISSKFYVSIENTVMALNSLKVSKATGPDDIPNWILKTYSTQLSGPVTSIFNASIQESYVPQQWKVADVIPINKVPIVKDLDNDLRPISLTPTLSKVMERFVWQWIMEDIGSCIDIRQFGSLPGSSTAHALISMIHHWLQSADKSNCVRAFFLDFSKAFDRIDHQVVCKKMMDMKIDITLRRWVQSFLSNRTQSVRLPDAQSSYEKVNGGVPQGTLLGPILFLIMVNDLVKMINQRWKYVDDTTISESLAKHEISNLQSFVDDISNWYCINKMKLNSSKCKEFFICYWKKEVPNFPPIKIQDQPVERVGVYKSLGVLLNDELKWNEHVHYITTKASKRLYMLRTLKKANADHGTLLKAYKTCVRPVLEYCAPVWHFNLPVYLSSDIERIQKRAMKIIFPNLNYNDALETSSLEALEERRTNICKNLFSKSIKSHTKMQDLLNRHPGNNNRYNLRYQNEFYPIKANTERFKNSYIPSMCK